MPLPWKKTRGNRISRIVADLQPQKRGSSLVVETGFPTSVIDLFVKNRDRMIKRQSSKKKVFSNHIDSYIIDSNSIAPPPTPLPSPDYSSFLRGNVVNSALIEGNLGILADEIRNVGGGGENENGVLVMKKIVFFVLGLVLVLVFWGLGIKKLVVGITLLAFLLFFVERFGKFVVGFLKPCSNVKMGINYWIEKIYGLFLIVMEWKISSIRREDSDDSDSGCELIDGGGEEEEASSCSIEEIQVLESNFINHNSEENERHDFLSREKRWGCLDYEEERRKMNLASKNNHHQQQPRSKSSKLKAKIIKKLIPKKLRSGKKLMKSTNKVEEVAGYQMGLDEEQNQNPNPNPNQNESISSYEEEQQEQEQEEDEKNGGMNENCEFSETGIMNGKKKKNNLMEKECIFLVVIILSGLLGGRFQAIVLSISGCFMFKLIKVLLNLKWKILD